MRFLIIALAILARTVWSDEDDKGWEEKPEKPEVELGTVIGIDLGTTYSW